MKKQQNVNQSFANKTEMTKKNHVKKARFRKVNLLFKMPQKASSLTKLQLNIIGVLLGVLCLILLFSYLLNL